MCTSFDLLAALLDVFEKTQKAFVVSERTELSF